MATSTNGEVKLKEKTADKWPSLKQLIVFLIPFECPLIVALYITLCLIIWPLFIVPLLHFAWIAYDINTPHAGGRIRKSTRNWSIWKTAAQYSSLQLVKTVELDPSVNYVCGFHPHGLYSMAVFGCFSTECVDVSQLFPGITTRVLSNNNLFWFPIVRELFLALGHCTTSKESINNILSQHGTGNAVIIVVGGEQEVFHTQPYNMKLKLKDRKGFVRLAVKNGAHLLPILSFGENEMYSPLLTKSEVKLLKTSLHRIVYCWALLKFVCPRLPKKVPITVVVGKPIEVVKDENASEEVIDKYHQQYIESLHQLFDEYKTKVGDKYKDMQLTLF